MKHFQKFQDELTQFIRNPQKNPAPCGVPLNRASIYPGLVWNNVEDTLSNCFPVCKKILGNKKWEILVGSFLENHNCQRPFFRQIPDEFMDYLQSLSLRASAKQSRPGSPRLSGPRDDVNNLPAFIPSLAHYEWIELKLFLEQGSFKVRPGLSVKKIINQIPVLNPVLNLVSYFYPVHQIGPKFQPEEKSPTPFYYIVYRDLKGKIEFMNINQMTAYLVSLLQKEKMTANNVLLKLARELKRENDSLFLNEGKKLLENFISKSVIVGFKSI